jgi:hypothetical protein
VSLYWNTSNATSVSISNLGTVNISGSQSVYPYTTTTYTLTAYGNGGSTSCTRTIAVQSTPVYDTPSCTLYANPSVVSNGGSSTLIWNTSNAYSVTIDNGVGSVQTNGSYTVNNVIGSRTYTLTAYGNGGTRTCQTTVSAQQTIVPPPTVAPAPSCGLAVQGDGRGGFTLAWYTQNALFSSIAGIGNVGPTGTYVVSPFQTTTYTMTVRGYDGSERTCQATAFVTTIGGGGSGGGFGGGSPVYYSGGGGTGGSGGGIPLAQVPYTGAGDYIYPLFIAAFALTSFYGAARLQKHIRFA